MQRSNRFSVCFQGSERRRREVRASEPTLAHVFLRQRTTTTTRLLQVLARLPIVVAWRATTTTFASAPASGSLAT